MMRESGLVLLLLTAMVPLVPGVVAQTPETSESLAPDAQGLTEVLVDPEGDAAAVPNDLDAPADILSVSFAETEDAVVLYLKARGYPDTVTTASEVTPLFALWCSVSFTFNGKERDYYDVELVSEFLLDGGPYIFQASMYHTIRDGNRWDWEDAGPLTAALVDRDHVEALIPKDLLTVEGRALRVGDRITETTAYCFRQVTYTGFSDEAGWDTPAVAYRIGAASGASDIVMHWPGETPIHTIGVNAGEAAKLNLILQNVGPMKLLVNLTAAIVDADGVPVPGWSVSATPTMEVGSGTSVPASLVVRAPADAAHRQGGILRVQAKPIGGDAMTVLKTPIVAVVSPDPVNNRLYFHGDPGYERRCFYIMDSCFAYDHDHYFMNVMPTDPVLGEEAHPQEGVPLLAEDAAQVDLDAPLSKPMRFDLENVIDLTVSVRTDVARSLEMQAYLVVNGDVVAYGQTTAQVGEAFGPVTMPMALRVEEGQFPEGSHMSLMVRFEENTPFFNFGGAWLSQIEWDLSGSFVTLPLLDALRPVLNVTDGKALPTIALGNNTDPEEYVNPGDSQAFDLLLLNEGTESDVVGLRADVSAPGWTVRFSPGERFSLAPGTAAPVCVHIEAPESASEGQVVEVNLTAWSRRDPDVHTSLPLKLIVTSGIEVEEDTCVERAPEEFVAPFQEKEERAPGPAVVPLVALLGGLAAALRRRR